MSQLTLRGHRHLSVAVPMYGRDPLETGRAATPLELFFDLASVVGVAFAAQGLHHALVEREGLEVLLSYAMVFWSIWWAWVNFTWFASAYDNDDVVYRLSVFVIMTGALVLAAGVPPIFEDRDFTLVVIGYVIMRIALVTQWVRVARDDDPRRETGRRYAIGVTVCQLGWLALILVPSLWPLVWLVFIPAELLVPVWAQRAEATTFHPEHIAERYGLLMIIVLGESMLAISLAIQAVMGGDGLSADFVGVIVGSLLITYSLWWIYFDRPEEHLLDSASTALAWSYFHLPVFAAAAAVGAGLLVALDEATGQAHLGWVGAGMAVAIPVVVFLVSLWFLYAALLRDRFHVTLVPITILALMAAAFTPAPVMAMGVILAIMVALKTFWRIHSNEVELALDSSHYPPPTSTARRRPLFHASATPSRTDVTPCPRATRTVPNTDLTCGADRWTTSWVFFVVAGCIAAVGRASQRHGKSPKALRSPHSNPRSVRLPVTWTAANPGIGLSKSKVATGLPLSDVDGDAFDGGATDGVEEAVGPGMARAAKAPGRGELPGA